MRTSTLASTYALDLNVWVNANVHINANDYANVNAHDNVNANVNVTCNLNANVGDLITIISPSLWLWEDDELACGEFVVGAAAYSYNLHHHGDRDGVAQ